MKRGPFFSAAVLLALFASSFILSIPVVEKVPLCFFHHLTGLDCPGCGLVRSFISISHGDLWQAVRYNALGPLVYLFFFIYLIRSLFRAFGEDSFRFSYSFPRGGIVYGLFAFLFWGQWMLKLVKNLS